MTNKPKHLLKAHYLMIFTAIVSTMHARQGTQYSSGCNSTAEWSEEWGLDLGVLVGRTALGVTPSWDGNAIRSFVRSKVAKLDIALALSLPPAKFRESERRGRCRCQRRIRKTRRSWETWERKSELWWWNGRFLWLVHALVRGAEVSKRLLGWLSRSKGFGRKYK